MVPVATFKVLPLAGLLTTTVGLICLASNTLALNGSDQDDAIVQAAQAKLLNQSLKAELTLETIFDLVKIVETKTAAAGTGIESKLGNSGDELGGGGGDAVDNLGKLADLADLRVDRCLEDHFMSLVKLRELYANLPVVRYLNRIIRDQRKWCENYLIEEASVRLEQFEPVTRDFIELFLRHDLIGRDYYVNTENAISKLREVAEAEGAIDKQAFSAKFGKPFFDSCRAIVASFGQLERIWQDYDIFVRLPLSCDKYFRTFELCKHLVDFDMLDAMDEVLFYDVKMRADVLKFGAHLAKFIAYSPEFEISHEPIAMATLDYALNQERSRILESSRSHHSSHNNNNNNNNNVNGNDSDNGMLLLNKEQLEGVVRVVDDLKLMCGTTVYVLDNLVWLIDFAGMDGADLIKRDDTNQTRLAELNQYLLTDRACMLAPEISATDLLDKHQRQASLELRKARRENNLFSLLFSFFVDLLNKRNQGIQQLNLKQA